MGKVGRFFAFFLVLLILGILGLLGFGALDAFALESPQELYTNYYRVGDQEYGAYVALPPGTHEPGSLPGVVMIHEWWGLDEETIAKADRLAAEGYLVVVPDALAGRYASTVPGALLLTLSTPADTIDTAVNGAFDYLQNHNLTDPGRLGIMGFCFGGREAMQFGVRDPRPRATITAYGGSVVTDDIGRLGANGPVLGIFGAEDGSIPLTEVAAFEKALNNRNVENTITVYEGVGHAFIKNPLIDSPGPSREAWSEMLSFLNRSLK